MQLSDREAATVLAALRNWQGYIRANKEALHAIASSSKFRHHFAEHVPLSNHEIDLLCEKINFGEPEG